MNGFQARRLGGLVELGFFPLTIAENVKLLLLLKNRLSFSCIVANYSCSFNNNEKARRRGNSCSRNNKESSLGKMLLRQHINVLEARSFLLEARA